MFFMCSVAILLLDSMRKHAQRCAYIYTHKYKLVNPILYMKLLLRTHYAHICAYALLINEGPGCLDLSVMSPCVLCFSSLMFPRTHIWLVPVPVLVLCDY